MVHDLGRLRSHRSLWWIITELTVSVGVSEGPVRRELSRSNVVLKLSAHVKIIQSSARIEIDEVALI